jgi:hypothetical protein
VTIDADALDDYISKRFKSGGGVTPETQARLLALERTMKSDSGVIDATVRFGPDEPTTPAPPPPPAEPEAPKMLHGDVIIPEEVGFVPPPLEARFRVYWANLVNTEFPGEIRQPTADQYRRWYEVEVTKPDEGPGPLAHLIQVSNETMADIRARSGWYQSPSRRAPEPRRGNRFGTHGDRFGRED